MNCQRWKGLALVAVLLLPIFPENVLAEGFRGGLEDAFGPRFGPDVRQDHQASKDHKPHAFDRAGSVRHWNEIAIDASGLDHTPVAPGENRVFGCITEGKDSEVVEEFGGPCRGRTYGPLIKSPAEELTQDTQQEESLAKSEDL